MIVDVASNELQIIAGGYTCQCVDSKKPPANDMLESVSSDTQACCRYCCLSCEARVFKYNMVEIKCTGDAVNQHYYGTYQGVRS